MAIYHCSTKTIGRTSGRSAVAASAYRSGSELHDERTETTHDFTKKGGVAHSEIISNLGVLIDRNDLWNMAEGAEKRKDARTAREWVIALPDELDATQRKDLAKEFAQSLVDKYGVVADLAIHEPSRGGDDRNHHAHIMLTTRKAVLDGDKVALTDKADIELSNAKREKLGLSKTQDEIKDVREMWADLANKALERAGQGQTIDHRSYAEQGNGLRPQTHENVAVTQLRRKGIETDISRFNDDVKKYNTEVQEEQKNAAMSLTERNRDTKTIVAEFRKTSAELSEIIYQDKYSEKTNKNNELVSELKEMDKNRPMFFTGKWEQSKAELLKEYQDTREELDRLGEHGAKSFIRMAENYLKQTDDWKHIDIDKEIQKSERAERVREFDKFLPNKGVDKAKNRTMSKGDDGMEM